MFSGTTIASILLLCALVLAGAVFWLKQHQILQREAFQALAARRGWSLTISEQKLGRPAILRLTARSGTGWYCESRLSPGPDRGMPEYLTTVFTAQDPDWPDGHLILTRAEIINADRDLPVLPKGTSQLSLQNRINLAWPDVISAQLRDFPAQSNLIARATHDPALRFDLEACANVLTEWQLQQANSDGLPLIQIGPEGFRVQVGHGMRKADQIESFIDFALDVIRVI